VLPNSNNYRPELGVAFCIACLEFTLLHYSCVLSPSLQHYSSHKRAVDVTPVQLTPVRANSTSAVRPALAALPRSSRNIVDVLHAEQPQARSVDEERSHQPIGTLPTPSAQPRASAAELQGSRLLSVYLQVLAAYVGTACLARTTDQTLVTRGCFAPSNSLSAALSKRLTQQTLEPDHRFGRGPVVCCSLDAVLSA
jgi:short subunit dehydrogenase-like uncharacterized protein